MKSWPFSTNSYKGLLYPYCAHETGILKDKVKSLKLGNSFRKIEVDGWETLLNTITASISGKLKFIETENTLHKYLTVKKHLMNLVMLITALEI